MSLPELNDRERRVLEAVIRSYVATAEPAGSRRPRGRTGVVGQLVRAVFRGRARGHGVASPEIVCGSLP